MKDLQQMESILDLGSFPLTVTVTTMGYRRYKNPLNKAPLRTVTGRGNESILDPNLYQAIDPINRT